MSEPGQSFGDPGSYPGQLPGYGSAGVVTRNAQVNLGANTSSYQQSMGQAAQATGQVSSQVATLSGKVNGLFQTGGRVLKIVGAGDVATLTGAAAAAANLQSEMAPLAATAAVVQRSMGPMDQAVSQTMGKFPSHQQDVVALVNQLTELGTKDRDLTKVASSVTKLGLASGESIPQLTGDIVQLNRELNNMNGRAITNTANDVLLLARSAGTSVDSVLQFGQSIAPIARQAGIAEPAILGIGTAFAKSGQDGYYAANAFNSIVSDITTAVQTGSPALTKYAALVGMTNQSFRRLPAAEEITKVFAAIGRGGPQAVQFMNDTGLGIRGLTAFQAVAQQGGLGRYIHQAERNASGTSALDRGAHAATDNLAATGQLIRNHSLQLIEAIGAPLLTPLGLLAKGFDGVVSVLDTVVHALGPLPAIIAGVLSTAALALPLAGFALSHVGPITGLAALRMFGRSGPARAFSEGRQTSAVLAGGMSEQEALGATLTGRALASGGPVPYRARAAFQMGRWSGRIGSTGAGAAAAEELGAGTVAARVGALGLSKTAFGLPAWYFGAQARGLSDSTKADYARSAYTDTALGGGAMNNAAVNRSIRERIAAITENVRATVTETTATGIVAGELRGLGSAVAGMAAQTVRAGASMAAVPVRFVGNRMVSMVPGVGPQPAEGELVAGEAGLLARSGSAVGAGIGAVASRAGSVLGKAGRMAFSLPGLMTMMVGLPLLQGLTHRANAADQEYFQVGGATNSVSRYDQLLGQTSTNLARFSQAVATAADKSQAAGESLGQAAIITSRDVARSSSSYKVTDPNWTTLHSAAPRNVGAAAAYIGTLAVQHGGMNAQYLNAIKHDLINVYGRGPAEQILQTYLRTGGSSSTPSIDFGALGTQARTAGGTGGRDLIAQAYSAIVSRAQIVPGPRSTRAELGSILRLGGNALLGSSLTTSDQRAQPIRALLARMLGGNASDYNQIAASDTTGTSAPDSQYQQLYGTVGASQATVLRAIAASAGGRKLLGTVGLGKLDISNAGQVSGAVQQLLGSQFPSMMHSDNYQSLIGGGQLGRSIAGTTLFQQAAGPMSGSFSKLQSASEAAASQALKFSASGGQATAALLKLSDDTTGAASTLLAGAAQWVLTLQQQHLPYMSREGQLTATGADLRQLRSAARQPNASTGTVQAYKDAQQSYASQKQSYDQFLIQIQQSGHDFRVQEERANQDYYLQVMRSQQDFQTQMARSEQDYHLSVFRSTRDFNLQMLRSQEDYQLQRGRSMQDFNIELARQAQQAAQSIYDPYSVVQAQQIESGGWLAQNLGSQNEMISRQYRQLRELRRAGLSQQAIDTLQLSDPKNAQEVNGLVQQLMNDPSTVRQINQAVSRRLQITTQLTQSSFNETFRNQLADFTRQLKRNSQDYQTAQQRAQHDQAVSLSDMAHDFEVSTSRAEYDQHLAMSRMSQDFTTQTQRVLQDLKYSFKQFYGSFADQMSAAFVAIGRDFKQYAPGLANDLIRELHRAQAAVNGFSGFGGGGGGGFGGAGTPQGGGALVGGVPGASKYDPITTPGTMGINPSGQIGSYGPGGRFHAAHNLTPQQAAQDARQHIASKQWARQHTGSASPVGGGLTQQRTDQGVDWGGSGSVRAIGAGKIVRVTPNDPGWGGSFTVLKLDNPPSGDRQYVYYAEAITPSVQVGQHVRAGQVIGRAHGGIEIGWADGITGESQARAHGQTPKHGDPGRWPTAYGRNFRNYIRQHGHNVSGDLVHASPGQARDYARAQLRAYGWGPGEFGSLDALWNHESGWRWNAANPSGAYGVPQALPGSKMAEMGSDWRNDASTQIDWGLSYIKGRYGSPQHAWSKWQQRAAGSGSGWYAGGSIFTGPQRIGVGERGPEAVIPLTGSIGAAYMARFYQGVTQQLLSQLGRMHRGVVGGGGGGGGSHIDTYVEDHSTTYSGPINLTPVNVPAMEAQLEDRARLRRLVSPRRAAMNRA